MTVWIPIVPPIFETRSETEEKDSHTFPGTHMKFDVNQVYLKYIELSAAPLQLAAINLPIPPGVPHPPVPPIPPIPPIPSIPHPPDVPHPPGIPAPPGVPTGKSEWRRNGPRVRKSADIHMTPGAVESMKQNEQLFANLMATFTAGTASLFFALGHEIYKFGLANAKNKDGSLDIHVSATGATAGGHPILLPPDTCVMILQGA
jgi:hypothetical protein